MPKKLKLNNLKVESFSTTLNDEEAKKIKGGYSEDLTYCDTYVCCTFPSKRIDCTMDC